MGKGIRHHSYFVHVLYLILYFLEKTLSPINLKVFLSHQQLGNILRAANAVQITFLTLQKVQLRLTESFNGTRMAMW